MKYLKLFESYNTETSEIEIDEAMQWFIDQFDVVKEYNIRKTICTYKTRDKFQITSDIIKEFTRLSQKIKCHSKLDLSYKMGDANYHLCEKFTTSLCKALLDYTTKNEIYSNELIISFTFAKSTDLLDPYYGISHIDMDVMRFDGVPYDLVMKLVSTGEMKGDEHMAGSNFTTDEILHDLMDYSTRITFNGLRVIDRPDARVQLEGFSIRDLRDEEMDELEKVYSGADEFRLNREKGTLSTWWD